VYSAQGELLYPYMGPWAEGCRITVVSGMALIVEWERGTNGWRETILSPGQTHVIRLRAPENGALIEGYPTPGFSVSIDDCTPQPVGQSPTTTTTTTTAAPGPSTSSSMVTLACTSSPCPWGQTLTGQAAVWPASMGAGTQRLGYTASATVYLPATIANGLRVSVTSGSASIVAGLPSASSHRVLATVGAGSSHVIGGLGAGEVVSVQSAQPFSYWI
jgi:hypothetical protein